MLHSAFTRPLEEEQACWMPVVTLFSVPLLTQPTVVDEASEIRPSRTAAVEKWTMVFSDRLA
jgi:hypothetical protein